MSCAIDLGTRKTNKFHRVPKPGHTANFDDIGRRATWRYVCRVPNGGTRQNVTALTDRNLWPRGAIFAVCRGLGTRRSLLSPWTLFWPCVLYLTHDKGFLRRVPDGLRTANFQAHGELGKSGSDSPHRSSWWSKQQSISITTTCVFKTSMF